MFTSAKKNFVIKNIYPSDTDFLEDGIYVFQIFTSIESFPGLKNLNPINKIGVFATISEIYSS